MNKLSTFASQDEAKSNEGVYRELEEMLTSRELYFSVFTNKITKYKLKQHIREPSKQKTILKSFMVSLKKYVKSLSQSMSEYHVNMEGIVSSRIKTIYSYYENWVAYI